MPVFQETSSAARDLRILPSRASPLPRVTPIPNGGLSTNGLDRREVVVIGAGPAGLFLTLLLARYGITGSSLLCLDAKPGTLKAGQADGLQPRTMEVFQSLGIASEILSEGCHMEEVAFWNPVTNNGSETDGTKPVSGIERTSFVPDVNVTARYGFEITIHQGRVERILQENLAQYAPADTIRRSHRFVEYVYDDQGDPEYPLVVKYDYDTENGTAKQGSLRTKYLVGGDGAHSLVRRCMGLDLQGETSDHIWGVCDFVADTNFPDIRKRCAVHSNAGSVMVIPREQIASGEYLTRLYVQVPGEMSPETEVTTTSTDKKTASKSRRGAVTIEYIFEQARAAFAPYKIGIKEGTAPDWWAAYQIGQRMTPKFISRTPDGIDRVFIVGDACHTHSPKAGQGMNVSMMDSYNLAWKLVHSINGLTPKSASETFDPVLETFESERLENARQLIEFDAKFSHMFSGQIGSNDPDMAGLTHEEFVRVFSEGSGFTSGCGLEYHPSRIVKNDHKIKGTGDPLHGALTPGRRLLSVELKRYADANLRHLDDELPSHGRYKIIILTSNDLLDRDGISQKILSSCIDTHQTYPAGTIDLAIIHPPLIRHFEWTDLPAEVKQHAEMRVYGTSKTEDAYEVYGVSKEEGAVLVVRPDGYVGVMSSLVGGVEAVDAYLCDCLVRA
ncbi:hypothetical protein AAFC00_007087 [Neodothiora populina]|uniref:Phenol monooxygenase n=1 Tax=Neodothiora populina TaxID=2781224 RepID=A0ABR3PC83_9PEZI